MNAPSTPAQLSSIRQIAITVSDLQRTKEFYRDTLGLALLFEIPSAVFFDCGGIRLLLGLPESDDRDTVKTKEVKEWFSSVVYFLVSDIQTAHRKLAASGVAFNQPPRMIAKMPDHDLWMAEFRDPDGNALALMSEVRA